jgi:superfamily I DNA and RNA helicase
MSSPTSITRGTNDKPVASRALARFFSESAGFPGDLLIGFPIISTAEGRHPIDALLVSPVKGIIVFDLVEGGDSGDFQSRQDDSANKLEARLKTHRDLLRRRDLLIPIHTITFAPGIHEAERLTDDGYPVANLRSLEKTLQQLEWPENSDLLYQMALSAIQSISTIRKSRTRRTPARENSRGAKLKRLEDSIATLDNLQSKAVLETVEGVQRIRGLAGSGKTIVLALKAAYLHAQHPEWRIAVTFNTRSLKGHFRRLINNFTVEQTGEDPDWDKLRILNAWGAPGGGEREGIYHQFCRAHGIDYFDFRSARDAFGSGDEFAGACNAALEQTKDLKPLYDAVLVDEAQDFPPAFLLLCYEILDQHKRLVYAYDELQNLSGSSVLPPEDIFGKKPDGTPRVSLEEPGPGEARSDVILDVCYRNSRPILVAAHALGFGVYRKPSRPNDLGLVQMFDHPQLWTEIGYRIKEGRLEEGQPVVLYRPQETSPKFLEEHSALDDIVQFLPFDSENAQTEWLIRAIKANLEEDELRHDDIVVINPDPLSTRKRVGSIRRRLLDMGINSHLAGVDTDPDIFFQSDFDSLTFTGIYRAKGNEAGMVYIINAQDCHSANWNLASIRNRLFTAMTRSKAWVRVLGVGEGMRFLKDEFDRLSSNDFELQFRYPTAGEREDLAIVHRDMTEQQRGRLQSRQQSLAELLVDLESGEVHLDDLDEALVARLKELLSRGA